MSKRYLKDKLIDRCDISEELRFIEESSDSYITKTGRVYVDYGDNKYYPLSTYKNKYNGYLYVGFKSKYGKMIQRRVHVLVAKAFLPNPNKYPYVCHKDGDKSNPVLTNLEWGTASKNTKDAYSHGLAKNSSGWDDSQSIPVSCFSIDGKHLEDFGSIGEASRKTGVTKSGILNQCKGLVKTSPRKGLIFKYYSVL